MAMGSAESCVTLRVQAHPAAATAPAGFSRVAGEFPFVTIELPPRHDAPVSVSVAAWRDPSFDFWAFDRAMDRAAETKELAIGIAGSAMELPDTSLELLMRCQRLVRRRNRESATMLFDGVLECHRALHDLSLPLVQADFDHALDVWQWVLRLAPGSSLAIQIAALFHDVERLASESERRIEQHAADYQAFKDRHAARGADRAAELLRKRGVPDEVVHDVAWLIATHERQSDDPDIALLNDADALSFFSLNSAGFVDYYGPDHTQKKVAYSLNRLRASARRYLDHVRLRPDVRAMVDELLGSAR